MRDATLCIPIKKGKIILGMKKRGFGKGKLNGFGGKINSNESIEEAAIRELEEELGIKAEFKNLKKVAELNFLFLSKQEWSQLVHVFLVDNWKGNPQESEEMSFEWFYKHKIPFDKMWADDRYWLPLVLEDKKIKASFIFDTNNETIKTKEIKEIQEK